MEAAEKEADNIMAIAYPSGPEPPLAEINTVTTQTAQFVPHTAPSASSATTVTDHLDCGSQPRLTSPAFMMNTIPDNQPGPTMNPPTHGQHGSGWKHKLLHNTNTGD